ncbi:hypothetical protein [Nonomuraea sp. NPDC049400]|uniref:hypothetical protein n=1 Tax=Nonomuraea sp. NPDC049400 TaxID=3364352 RepID=UPI00379133D0
MQMASVRIDFTEGFDDDEIILRVADEVVFHKRDVTTMPLIGLADSVELALPGERLEAEVELPGRGTRTRLDVHVGGRRQIAVSVDGSALSHVVSAEGTEFGYG